MCRPRPGPRCSSTATRRIDAARKHLEAMYISYNAELESKGKVSSERTRYLENAECRLQAAETVFFATPKGQSELVDKIAILEHQLAVHPPGELGDKDWVKAQLWRSQLAQTREQAEQGVRDRENAYRDLKLVATDPKPAYAQNSAVQEDYRQAKSRGDRTSRLEQPMTQEAMDAMWRDDPATAEALVMWSDEEFARADSWVEQGASVPWSKNKKIDKPEAAEGKIVEVPETTTLRVNLPDGQIAEGKADSFLTHDGEEYLVTEQMEVASTWEDASPRDHTNRDLGYVLSKAKNVSRRKWQKTSRFGSLDQAKDYLASSRKRLQRMFPFLLAKLARSAFIQRAQSVAKITKTNFTFPTWP